MSMQGPDDFNALDDRRRWRRITALVYGGLVLYFVVVVIWVS